MNLSKFETNPELYQVGRNIHEVSLVLGFQDPSNFLNWIYGCERQAMMTDAPVEVFGYDPFMSLQRPFRVDSKIWEEMQANHTLSQAAINHIYDPNTFDLIVASVSYGIYSLSVEDFFDQTRNIYNILKFGGKVRFNLFPYKARFVEAPGFDFMLIDATSFSHSTEFQMMSPYRPRWERYPVKCLEVLSSIGFKYSLIPSLSEREGYFLACEATKE